MPTPWINMLLFPVVGALIGAVTNQLALKMLFRPYKAVYIGRWRLPFTPGVIPSQRHKIAKDIARVFEENLLSGNDIHKVITGTRTRQIIIEQVDDVFAKLGPFSSMVSSLKPMIVNKMLNGIEIVGKDVFADRGDLNIAERIEERLNAMDLKKLEELIIGITRRQLRHITFSGALLGALIGVVQGIISFYTMS